MSDTFLGVLIGAAVGLLGGYLQNRYATRRDQLARSEERRNGIRNRQRTNLVELRDATLDLMTAVVTDMSTGTDETLKEAVRMAMRVRTLGVETSLSIAQAAVELYDVWVDATEMRRGPKKQADDRAATRFRDAAEELVARVGHELGLLDGPWPSDARR